MSPTPDVETATVIESISGVDTGQECYSYWWNGQFTGVVLVNSSIYQGQCLGIAVLSGLACGDTPENAKTRATGVAPPGTLLTGHATYSEALPQLSSNKSCLFTYEQVGYPSSGLVIMVALWLSSAPFALIMWGGNWLKKRDIQNEETPLI